MRLCEVIDIILQNQYNLFFEEHISKNQISKQIKGMHTQK